MKKLELETATHFEYNPQNFVSTINDSYFEKQPATCFAIQQQSDHVAITT